MITIDQVLAFGAAALLIIVVPGPGVLFVVGRALASGRRVALASAAGHEVGGLVLVVAVALGIGSLMERSILLYSAVKLVGAGYLIFLGIQALRHRRTRIDLDEIAGAGQGVLRSTWDGFLVGVTNPKGAIFFAAVLPQFVSRSGGPVQAQMLLLGSIFAVLALACDSVWILTASVARSWFARSTRRLEAAVGAGGVTMIGLGVAVAVSGRKE